MKQMAQERVEYWLLEYAVTLNMTLDWLLPENLDYVDYEPHGLDARQLANTLHHLFQAGDIAARRVSDLRHSQRSLSKKDQKVPLEEVPLEGVPVTPDGFGPLTLWSSVPTFMPTLEEIEAALSPGDDQVAINYGLTAQGGARWELLSRPDWSRFFRDSYRTGTGETISCDRKIVAECIRLKDIATAVQEWDVLTPWQATYWKVLPHGHRVRYQCEDQSRAAAAKAWEAWHQWFINANRWYTNPYA